MLFRMAAVRVRVVSDDPLARGGLTQLLQDREDVALVEERPDVVVWEFVEGGEPRVRGPAALVAVLSDESQAAEARSAGARGMLLRSADGDRLAAAVLAVASGLTVLDDALSTAVLRPAETRGPVPAEELTPRELEVLQLLAQGLTNRRIAERLGISDHTAKFHVNAILGKLGAQTRTEAIVQAARLGLVIL
jgi:DNA-binding NarL/FixJ family response regulator